MASSCAPCRRSELKRNRLIYIEIFDKIILYTERFISRGRLLATLTTAKPPLHFEQYFSNCLLNFKIKQSDQYDNLAGYTANMNLRKTILLFASLILFLTLLIGYFYFASSLKHAVHLEQDKANKYISSLSITLSSHISAFQQDAKLLADHDLIREAFLNNNQKALITANTTLDYFKKNLDADVCYLMDLNGNTIASSNRNSTENFVGKNYSFRPYFKEAIQGNPYVYLALGATSKERGIYCSQPVYGKNREILQGVAVIKTSIQFLQIESSDIKNNIIALSNPDGLVFSSNRQDLLYKLLWKPAAGVLESLRENQQFGPGPWSWIGMAQEDEDHAIDAEKNRYFIHLERVEKLPGWDLIFFHNTQSISNDIYNPLFKSSSVIILSTLTLFGALIILLYLRSIHDLHKKEAAENALIESEQRFRSLSEASFEGIVIHDNGSILETNQLFAAMFGYDRPELTNRNLLELSAPESRDEVRKRIASRPESPYELVGLRKDGSTFMAEINGKTIPYKGQPQRVVAIRDITEQKQAAIEREGLITKLQKALEEINTLRGVLPICASCKKIRDDGGYWNQIESYIKNHTEAEFTHGICPDCVKKLYPDFTQNNGDKKNH